MKIYLLKRGISRRRKLPDSHEAKSMIVIASDEAMARDYAALSRNPEEGTWKDPRRSSCEELGTANHELPSGVFMINMGTVLLPAGADTETEAKGVA